MSEATENPKPQMPARKLVRIFLATMLGYMLLVHIWSLTLPPMGSDYAALGGALQFPAGYAQVFELQTRMFNTWVIGYHLVNLALLYGCMVSLFFLTWHILRGPIWMGSLAAVLMMAHPLKTEAVLQLSGSLQLLPALFSLSCLACYAAYLRRGRARHLACALLTFTLLSPIPLQQLGVLAVLALLQVGLPWRSCNPFRPLPFVAVNAAAQVGFGPVAWEFAWPDTAVALFLAVYPFGLLPETAARLAEFPAFAGLAVTVGAAVIGGLGLLARERGYWLAVSGAAAYVLAGTQWQLDWVHLAGGGAKVPLVSLAAVACCALVQRMFASEPWRRPLVALTSLMCVFLFGVQIYEIISWRFAAEQAGLVHSQIMKQTQAGECVIIAPSFGYYRTAPMMPGVALQFDTPFHEQRQVRSVLPVKFNRGETMRLTQEAERLILRLDEDTPAELTAPMDPKCALLVPFGVQEGDRWVIRTPPTWLQRMRERELAGTNRVQ